MRVRQAAAHVALFGAVLRFEPRPPFHHAVRWMELRRSLVGVERVPRSCQRPLWRSMLRPRRRLVPQAGMRRSLRAQAKLRCTRAGARRALPLLPLLASVA